MKKLVSFLLVMTLVFSSILTITTNAAVGDVVGQAVHTDIVAYINHYAVPSYAANGKSCIVAEDLRNFGFDVIWDGNARTLSIYRNANFYPNEMTVDKTVKPGTFFSNILETDIVVYANGQRVTSYALNGYTMIPIEELTMFGAVYWVPEERAIKLWIDGFNQRATKQQPIITMYAAGGRTITISASEMETYKAAGWSTEPIPVDRTVMGVYSHTQYDSSVVISEYDGYNIAFEIVSIGQRGNRIATTFVRDTLENGVSDFYFEDSWGNTGRGTLKILGKGQLSLSFYNVKNVGLWSVDAGDGYYNRSGNVPYGYEPMMW